MKSDHGKNLLCPAVLNAATNMAIATVGSVPYAFSRGARVFSQTFAAASSVTLAFGVVDLGDYAF
jgi:hypothetical protein